MSYRSRPPRKNFLSYFTPFLLITLIFAGIFYAFNTLLLEKTYFKSTYGLLEPGDKGVEILIAGKENWNEVATKLKVFSQDAIKTKSEIAKISFPGSSEVTVGANTSLILDDIEGDNSYSVSQVTLSEGRIWLNAERMINPKSNFTVKASNLEISTRGGVFAIESNTIRSVEGEAIIKILNNGKEIGNLDVGVGQELILTEQDLANARLGKMPELSAISDEFKLSEWYHQNYRNEDVKLVESSSYTEKVETSTASGEVVEEKEKAPEEKKEEIVAEAVKFNHEGEISFDIEEKEIEISADEKVTISGKVPTNVAKVVVNDWVLTKFEKGDLEFSYNAALQWENLKEGKNIFKVQVYDEDGILVKEKELELEVKIKKEETSSGSELSEAESKTEEKKTNEEVSEEAEKEAKVAKTEETEEQKTPEKVEVKKEGQALQITSHKDGEVVSLGKGQALEISGIAPENTVKITVGDYTLTGYKEGEKEFLFRVAEEWGNLKRGENNVYVITAYNSEKEEIESLKFNLFVEE